MTARFKTDEDILLLFAKSLGVTLEDAKVISSVFGECIKETLVDNGCINIKNLGTFTLRSRRNIKVRDNRGNEILVPLRYRILFQASASLMGAVNTKVKKSFKTAFEHAENHR